MSLKLTKFGKLGYGKMENLNNVLNGIDNIVWGVPLILIILLTGIYLTIRLRGFTIRRLGTAFKYIVKEEKDGSGEISSFAALCTSLSATIGTGNIIGVATAIYEGGPGALFWMIVAAFFGLATKFAEGFLAIKYRKMNKKGHILGGPFYYIENGMGKGWKWLAKLFAFFGMCVGLFGIGTFTQVNGISSAVQNFFDKNAEHCVNIMGRDISWAVIISGLVVTIFAALVIIGGIKRISAVSEIVVPFMSIFYILLTLTVVIFNYQKLPAAIVEIFQGAFGIKPFAGGMLGTIIIAMQKGIARGIFSNEAGLGSAPIAAAAARTKEPVRQGLVSMTGTFIDTVILCTMTGLSIIVAGSWNIGLEGVQITAHAFSSTTPLPESVTSFALMVCLVFFAFTTILGWNYYSERCVEYLTNRNERAVKVFRWLYIAAVFIGPYMTVSAVWTIADIFNGLMAIPNIIALLVLSPIVAKETLEYSKKLKHHN